MQMSFDHRHPRETGPDRTGIVLRRPALVMGGCVAGLLLAWSGATAWYVLARDEIAQTVFARQAELRYGYEDRIAELKGQLEREITRNMVERNGVSARTDAIALRQRELEARQAWLNGLAERLTGGGALAERASDATGSLRGPREPDPAAASTKPSPLPGSFGLRPGTPADGKDRASAPADRLSAVERSLSRVAQDATASMDVVRKAASERAGRIRQAIEATRVAPARASQALAPMPAGVFVLTGGPVPTGGPLVPLPTGVDSVPFHLAATETEAQLSEFDALRSFSLALPLGRPLAEPLEQTSGFGYRLDPFTRGPALHTGIDFRADAGGIVRATAGGRVAIAEPTGGYGNMIEIEHAAGVATRYGHLSAFLVSPGMTVVAGQAIGRAGSTGRSTGTHLHYETRVDGEPVNPQRFLNAGRILSNQDVR